jgi:hypothetical protein
VADLDYRDHLIYVCVIHDTPSQYQFSPIVEIRRAGSGQVLNTIMTREGYITEEMAIEFGFGLGREWIDKRLSESPSSED